MTRLTSRAWKRNARLPPASFSTLAPGPSVQFPDSAHWFSSNRSGTPKSWGSSNSAMLADTKFCPCSWPR